MSDAPLLEVRAIVKNFPGVRALRGVHLTLHRGEVLALIGENGAGKSTLMKILAGVQTPDSGEVRISGGSVSIDSVHASISNGIALIHQDLNLSDNLDVRSNLFLGREPRRFVYGLIDRRKVNAGARQVLERMGLDIDPETPLS